MNEKINSGLAFLDGSTEMGARMQRHDWSASPLRSPRQWPTLLCNATGLIISSSFPMFVLWGKDFAYVYNDGYAPILGARHPAALGTPFLEVWPELRESIFPIIERAHDGESNFFENLPVVLERNGYPEQTWFTFSYSPVRDENGVIEGVLCACTETTEQIRTKQRQEFYLELAERSRQLTDPNEIIGCTAEMLGSFLQAGSIGYAEVSPSVQVMTVRTIWTSGAVSAATSRTGAPDDFSHLLIDDLRAGRIVSIVDTTTDARSKLHAQAFANLGTRSILAVPFVKAGRLSAILSVTSSAPRNWTEADVLIAREVGERLWSTLETARAEQALLEQKAAESERLRALFAQAPGFMAILKGPNHVFEFANSAYMKLTGNRNLIGKPAREAIPDAEGQGFFELLDKVFETGQPIFAFEALLKLQHVPGGPLVELFVDFVYQPVTDADGTVTGIFVEGYEVTERKRASNALREADRRKDEFLAMLAHELRNPLAPISASADLLELAAHDENRVRRIAAVISRQTSHITSLLDDLLDVSRVTRGLVTLEKQAIEFKGVIADASEQVRPLMEKRRHNLTICTAPEPACVQGDRTRLVQIVANLLNNAAKYTPEGGEIHLHMMVHDAEIECTVRDNGSGISSELLPNIFDLFIQGMRSPDRSEGGLGLGLALVRSLVELHGGRVTVASEGEGLGSRFTFTLPKSTGQSGLLAPSRITSELHAGQSGLRILVVDDNVDAARSMAMLLDAAGHEVSVEHTAHAAIARAGAEAPDVLLLDIGLPDMDGYALAEALREMPETAGATMIALTGYGGSQDRQRSASAGFAHHFVKPASASMLSAVLADISTLKARRQLARP